MELTIYTYGGTAIAESILNAVAMLMNSQTGSLYRPLMMMTASIGAFWATAKALFSPSFQSYIGQYFLPMVALMGILMVPSTKVRIEDKLIEGDVSRVDHVPFLLAQVASFVSRTGHYLTQSMEGVMHTPNNAAYNSTGMIFGAQTSMEIENYQITNADLDQNLRRFCKQCVLYDIHLGLYSQDDLMKSTDLFAFLQEKTSKVRLIDYYEPGKGSERNLKSCKEAMKSMKEQYSKEIEYYNNHDLLKNLPAVFESLTGLSADSKNIISQQLMMNTFRKEYTGEGFAKSRSRMQQKSTYRIMGALAANSLIAMRNVLEVLIYASFIFIMPMMMLPGGIGFFGKWVFLLVWIQMWPPFFVILDYVMQSIAQGQSASIFHGLSQSDVGLSLFTSIGLTYLQEDIYALAGYLSASIPFISYALIQGGAGSFVHLAGAMLTPAHTSAAAAASEQVTGNYSYGNVNWGNTQFENATTNQRNFSASVTGGYMRYDNGMSSYTQTADGSLVDIRSSSTREGWISQEQMQGSLNMAIQETQSIQETAMESLSSSLQEGSKTFIDTVDHLSKGQGISSGLSQNDSVQVSESARYMQNVHDNLAKTHSVDSRVANQVMLGLRAGLSTGTIIQSLGIDLGASGDLSHSKSSGIARLISDAESIYKSDEYQKSFQEVQEYSDFRKLSENRDTGERSSFSVSESVDSIKTTNHSLQKTTTQLEQLQKTESFVKTHSDLFSSNKSQAMMEIASQMYSDLGGADKVIQILKRPMNDPEKQNLINRVAEKIHRDVEDNWSSVVTDSRNATSIKVEAKKESVGRNMNTSNEENLKEVKEDFNKRYEQKVVDSGTQLDVENAKRQMEKEISKNKQELETNKSSVRQASEDKKLNIADQKGMVKLDDVENVINSSIDGCDLVKNYIGGVVGFMFNNKSSFFR